MKPLAYQYNKFLLEETELYITKGLKKMAEDTAKTRGEEQIQNVKTFLDFSLQPECVVLASFKPVAQTSEPQQPETVQHNVSETKQLDDVSLTNIQVTAKQTEQEQPEGVLRANIEIETEQKQMVKIPLKFSQPRLQPTSEQLDGSNTSSEHAEET